MSRQKVSTTVWIEARQLEALNLLRQRTRVPVAEYVRQGIDLVLTRHRQAQQWAGRDGACTCNAGRVYTPDGPAVSITCRACGAQWQFKETHG